MNPMYDFANILFSGPCNASCYFCIGQEVDPRFTQNNLKDYPLRNLTQFIALIQEYKIQQVVLTGTNTDPQLYQHEAKLLGELRSQLPSETQISLHSNGRLAAQKIEIFNQYDRATLSIPSFHPDTYQKMMGVPGPPDLGAIQAKGSIPIKLSCLVSKENGGEIPRVLAHCRALGLPRVVLRKRFGERKPWDALIAFESIGMTYQHTYRNNPVFDLGGLQITLWDFHQSTSRSINLYASGEIRRDYLIAPG
jgi:molybdenum cofactor biosynthesis enzyme MoaA